MPSRFDIDDAAEHGEVFTRRWVVELILDLVGYTPDRPLHELTVVESACGSGAFLGPIAERVSASCRAHDVDLLAAQSAVRAFDVLPRNVHAAKTTVQAILRAHGWPENQVMAVTDAWITRSDFLLDDLELDAADFVVGNPPYIRLEDMPSDRTAAYRQAWPTMAGRADIYIGFIERGLSLLGPDGTLGYICADRWMRNQYGSALRKLFASWFSVDAVITMHDVDAFDSAVSAYPAITVIGNRPQEAAVVVETNSSFNEMSAARLANFISAPAEQFLQTSSMKVARLPHWFSGEESWPQGSPGRVRMLEYLADNFPALEDTTTATRVGIGVATGADSVYVIDAPIDIEPDRLLPLSGVKDIASGRFTWSGHYLVNPWDETGLVELAAYPELKAYFEKNSEDLRRRNIASRQPRTWFRTIDRVNPNLTTKPKLLLQDMRLKINPVLDNSASHPHHNLYFVVSEGWDIKVLGGILMSDVVNAIIEAYAVRMRGGTLRFQAQYLRRIRVPRLDDVGQHDRAQLIDAFERRDTQQATSVALRLYGLTELPE